jgi:hypothetical protein
LRTPAGNLKENPKHDLRKSLANPKDTLGKHQEHIKDFIRAT